MKNSKFTLIIIAVIVIAFLMGRCGKNKKTIVPPIVKTEIKIDTVVIKDTVFVNNIKKTGSKLKTDSFKIVVPDTNYNKLLSQFNKQQQEFEELFSMYYGSNSFENEIDLNGYGNIKIWDTISQNSFTSRKHVLDLKIPVKTETITITKEKPSRSQLYLGMSILGNNQYLLGGAELNLNLKTKKHRMYEIGVLHWNSQPTIYKIGTKIKL